MPHFKFCMCILIESSDTMGDIERQLSRAGQEIEQLRVDHEVAVEKKEKQVRQSKLIELHFCCIMCIDIAIEDIAGEIQEGNNNYKLIIIMWLCGFTGFTLWGILFTELQPISLFV